MLLATWTLDEEEAWTLEDELEEYFESTSWFPSVTADDRTDLASCDSSVVSWSFEVLSWDSRSAILELAVLSFNSSY